MMRPHQCGQEESHQEIHPGMQAHRRYVQSHEIQCSPQPLFEQDHLGTNALLLESIPR